MRERLGRLSRNDALIALLVFVVGAFGGWTYLNHFGLTTGPDYGVSDTFRPAIGLALGEGFAEIRSDAPALREFIAYRVDELDVAALPEDTEFSNAGGKFYLDRVYLLYAVGIVWWIFGISWTTLNLFLAFMLGLNGALFYGIFRLGMGRIISVTGSLIALFSPPMLAMLPAIRDFSKAPFILATLLLCGYLVSRPVRPRNYLLLAALFGLYIGVGFGFRQDAIICIPPALGFIAVFAHGTTPLRIPVRALAVALLIGGFLIPAWPCLRMTADTGGNNAFYLAQGFSMQSLTDLDLEPREYTPFYTHSDFIMHGYVYDYAESNGYDFHHRLHDLRGATRIQSYLNTQASVMQPGALLRVIDGYAKLNMWSFGAEIITREFVRELFTTFPGDVVARWYAAALRTVRGMPAEFRGAAYADGPALQQWTALQAPYFGHMYRYGLFYAAGVLLLLAARRFWLALSVLLLALYFFGYTSLSFQYRHAFHLGFVCFWMTGFYLARAVELMRARPQPTALRWATARPVLLRGVAFVLAAFVMLGLPLFVGRVLQSRNVADLVAAYRDVPVLPLETDMQSMPDGESWLVPRTVPPFEDIPQPGFWNDFIPTRRVPDVVPACLAADVIVTAPYAQIRILYDDIEVFFDGFDEVFTGGASLPRRYRYYFPVFHFTEALEHQADFDPAEFVGIMPGPGIQVEGLSFVEKRGDLPLLLNLWLPEDGPPITPFYRLKWWTAARDA